MKRPGINWYIGINKIMVENDIEKNPVIIKQIPPSLLKGFIQWAANQRISYIEDLKEEVNDFIQNYYAKNLSWINVKKKYHLYEIVSKRDGAYCKHCISNKDLTLDHIIPRSLNGSDTIDNLQILCRKCNSSKSNKAV